MSKFFFYAAGATALMTAGAEMGGNVHSFEARFLLATTIVLVLIGGFLNGRGK